MYRRLRDLREDKDMTQAQIGGYLNMSQTGYSQYELGINDIPTFVLKKLALFYGVSTDYILELTDEMKPYPKSK